MRCDSTSSLRLGPGSAGVVATLAMAAAAHGQCTPGLLASLDTPDTAFDVVVSGNLAYLADGQTGLRIIDISDPSNPVVLSVVDTPGIAFGVALEGTTAYVADAGCGLEIIDVSDPENGVILGDYDTPDFSQGVAVQNGIAYVADQFGGLQIIDVSVPANPIFLGELDTPDRSLAVAVSGDFAFVADQLSGVIIVDVSDPTTPVLRSVVGSADRALGVTARGTMVFGAVRTAGLQVIDASDPDNPVVLDTIATADRAIGVAVAGTRAYVADGLAGMKVIDIGDPENLAILGAVATPGGDANRIAVLGTEVFVANFAGLRTINVAPCFGFGACCVNGSCVDLLTPVSCAAVGGAYVGADTVCAAGVCFNDDCDAAITITEGDTPFSTIGATTDGPALPPECDENPADFQKDVWFRYIPPATGTLMVSTCDQADFDTRLGAYTGVCGKLELLECRDEGDGVCTMSTSLLDVAVTHGVPVLLRVGGNGPHSGSGTLTLTLVECDSDIDGDRIVNIVDLLRVITDWGPCP